MLKKNVDIGAIIKGIVKKREMKVTEFSRRLGFSNRNYAYSLVFNKRSLDTDMLREISILLEYNFFSEYFEKEPIKHRTIMIEADEKKIEEIMATLSDEKSVVITEKKSV